MTGEEAFARLEEIDRKITMLSHIAAVLEWDNELYAPILESEERGRQMGYLSSEIHILETSDEMGELVSRLEGYGKDDFEKALIRERRRAYRREKALPPDLVLRLSQAKARGYAVWVQARKDNDFKAFIPSLKEIVSLSREAACAYAHGELGLYDALLDGYEEGMTCAEVDRLFGILKPVLCELVSLRSAEKVDDSFLRKPYEVAKQDAFANQVMTDMGFDFTRGCRGVSAHPFTSALGNDDVRITTRYTDPSVMDSFFSTVHESGHALYEQAASSGRLKGTSLAGGASYGMHESQSRLWENLIGRSRAFWDHYYPLFRQIFPEQTEGVSQEAFYHAVNKVGVSYIRTNADEVSYGLHIMLRYELEKRLVSGELMVEEVPSAWNELSQNLLGLPIRDDRQGCLQDVHWASGDIGYFPTYVLGNLYGAQIWSALSSRMDVEKLLSEGDLRTISRWLAENIYVNGMLYTPQDLLFRVTGRGLDAKPFTDYLVDKYRTSW